MSYLKRNLLTLFLFLSFPILSDINKNPFKLIDTKSQEMVVVLTTENELFNTNPELFKNKIKNIFEKIFRTIHPEQVIFKFMNLIKVHGLINKESII